MITDNSQSRLKHTAIEYFRTHSSLYTERYSVAAAGDVLWPRHRALLRMVLDMKLPRSARFLDLGCGPGFLGVDLARLGYRRVGLDAAPAMIQRLTAPAAAVSPPKAPALGDAFGRDRARIPDLAGPICPVFAPSRAILRADVALGPPPRRAAGRSRRHAFTHSWVLLYRRRHARGVGRCPRCP